MTLFYVALVVFILNLPFGYWRAETQKFSLQWILAIHLPVPLVIATRFLAGLGFQLYTYPFLIFAYFSGQYLGAKLHSWISENGHISVSACLFRDLYRIALDGGQKDNLE